MAPEPKLPGEIPDVQDDPERYVGLDQQAAQEQALAQGWSTVRAVPPGAMLTMEYLVGRINFEVKDGVVARSWRG
ncbi:I78 family peptidase inhibitor [Streptomyces sp. NPDC057555]|uniref:I78 family peptidase inhibitor n=1 Tax=Streptomyces sp. NPDC057555 TaxID=3346166 RepID=UPI0036C078A9